MSITRASVHVAVDVPGLFRDLILGTTTLNRGVVGVIEGMRKQTSLKRFTSSTDSLTIRKPNRGSADFSDTMDKDERQIVMGEVEHFDSFDPQDFNKDFPELWSQGPSARTRAAATLEAAIVPSQTQHVGAQLDRIIWQGDTAGAGILVLFDGFIKLFDADADVINPTPIGVITEANVQDVLKASLNAVPADVREQTGPEGLMIVLNHSDKYLYEDSTRSLDTKGQDVFVTGTNTFSGVPIISVSGLPKDRVVITHGNNLKAAMWMDSDRTTPVIDRFAPPSDLWFILFALEMGVNHVFGSEVVFYKPV